MPAGSRRVGLAMSVGLLVALLTLPFLAARTWDESTQQTALSRPLSAALSAPKTQDTQSTTTQGDASSRALLLPSPTASTSHNHAANRLQAVVVRVVDGDTIVVRLEGGKEERVRLIGINTPESVDPRRPVECFGKEAAEKTRELLDGRRVFLELDPTQGERDRYGRLLAYVYRDDGVFVNLRLIEEGYAYEYTYATPYRYQAAFKEAQVRAQQAQRGLWHPQACASHSTHN